MKIFYFKTASWVLLACTAFFFNACSKNSINIDLGDRVDYNRPGKPDNGNGGDDDPNQPKTLVAFHASIESRNMTRSLSPMREDITSRIYAFKSPITSLETPSAEGLYTTSSIGMLTGVDEYKMYLPNGVYTFFGISSNNSSHPIQFNGQYSTPLVNGVDYLWACNKLQDVTSTQVNMPILFQHMATQVVFKVSGGTGIKLDKLISATITPSKPGATMNLITGEINSATGYDSPATMGINGFTAQYIMLPIVANTPMSLVLQILADGETNPRTYTVDVPLPDNKLIGGDSYVFSAVIDGNTVIFPNVEVLNWTEVDETGKPLYPTQESD